MMISIRQVQRHSPVLWPNGRRDTADCFHLETGNNNVIVQLLQIDYESELPVLLGSHEDIAVETQRRWISDLHYSLLGEELLNVVGQGYGPLSRSGPRH